MDDDRKDHPSWFNTREIESDIYLTTEDYYYAGNRANIWFIRGSKRDVIIDTGLGVCNLKKHFEKEGLLTSNREYIVILTHSHFDHSGGAHHLNNVYIHKDDYQGLSDGDPISTLNWSDTSHYRDQPYLNFKPKEYKVPPTECIPIDTGHRFDLGDENDQIEIIHVPGHTPGSILCYYPKKKCLFTGDFVYHCGDGSCLLDWIDRASIQHYLNSAHFIINWLNEHQIENIYPGHYRKMNVDDVQKLLKQYILSKQSTN